MRLRCSVDYMILIHALPLGVVGRTIKTVFIAGELYDIVDTVSSTTLHGSYDNWISIRTPLHNELVSLNSYEVENYFHSEEETRDSLIQAVLN